MNKREQLVKELQALIDKPEMNEIIEQKMGDAWFEGRNESSREWVEKQEVIFKRLKEGLPDEIKEAMVKSHIWVDREYESECARCGIDDNDVYERPNYCLTKEERES